MARQQSIAKDYARNQPRSAIGQAMQNLRHASELLPVEERTLTNRRPTPEPSPSKKRDLTARIDAAQSYLEAAAVELAAARMKAAERQSESSVILSASSTTEQGSKSPQSPAARLISRTTERGSIAKHISTRSRRSKRDRYSGNPRSSPELSPDEETFFTPREASPDEDSLFVAQDDADQLKDRDGAANLTAAERLLESTLATYASPTGEPEPEPLDQDKKTKHRRGRPPGTRIVTRRPTGTLFGKSWDEEAWNRLSSENQRRITHAGRIEETVDGVLRAKPCFRCSRKLGDLPCRVYTNEAAAQWEGSSRSLTKCGRCRFDGQKCVDS